MGKAPRWKWNYTSKAKITGQGRPTVSEPVLRVRSETWSGGETRSARRVARPLTKFLAQKTSSGFVLLGATALALILVNVGFSEQYHEFWETNLSIDIGSKHLIGMSLHGWVNDALMALFFFVVGMEIKTELVAGDLANPQVAALPVIGALGGMVVPAVIYLAINLGGVTGGWGVPMATDIAFAVGVMAMLGPRIPQSLKLFLLTLAIVDDIGAIVVIAVFYTTSISAMWLALAVGLVAAILVLRKLNVWYIPIYAVIGLVVWFATHESGVHATIAGVGLGLLTPARPLIGARRGEAIQDILAGDTVDPVGFRDMNFKLREQVPVTGRLIALFSPWTSFLVIPLFALANAGVKLNGESLSGAMSSRVAWGVILGLVVGKPLGIWSFCMIGKRFGLVSLPPGLKSMHLAGVGAVAGIGFTMALFISGLAFEDAANSEAAVMGILAASVVAAIVGWLILLRSGDGETDTMNYIESLSDTSESGNSNGPKTVPQTEPVGTK